jgi:hypothetical protein
VETERGLEPLPDGEGVEEELAMAAAAAAPKKTHIFSFSLLLLRLLPIPQVSKKRYIYTIDDDCFVAQTPSGELRER